MASPPRRNDRRRRSQHGSDGGADWIWGRHAVRAALANPRRTAARRLIVAAGRTAAIDAEAAARLRLRPEQLESHEIARLLPPGAVHQGVALLSEPPEPASLEDLGEPAKGVLVLLDQVADPQNVGAIFRSAAAFGARGVILQERRAPPLSGAVAKAAAGAVDRIPAARVVNLSRALDRLSDLGWRTVGLAGDAPILLAEAIDARATVLVLGSEGEGLRRLVADHCDVLARIPMPGGAESLNVAAAAAVALYESARARA